MQGNTESTGTDTDPDTGQYRDITESTDIVTGLYTIQRVQIQDYTESTDTDTGQKYKIEHDSQSFNRDYRQGLGEYKGDKVGK